MRRRGASSIVANPILVGAVVTLVIVIGVFLAYNANKGLPFVPTFQLRVETPDASRLVVGNDVREGGQRIGQVAKVDPVPLKNHHTGAELTLALDKTATPVPADSSVIIRTRSALGLKFVELIRGTSKRALPQGTVLQVGENALRPEIDDFFNMFTPKVRAASQTNLSTFGGGLAARGAAINETLGALPPLLRDLRPVMQTLAAPSTRLAPTIEALARTASAVAPVAGPFARGFTSGAQVFGALSRDPAKLRDTIAQSPGTLDVAHRSLAVQRPFLRALADVSGDVRATAAELRRAAPPISGALLAGTRNLPKTPPLSRDLKGSFTAVNDLSTSPTTNIVLQGLDQTVSTLDPLLRYLGPHITVCNYWNYWWTLLSADLSEEVDSGTLQRVESKTSPNQTNSMDSFGATAPANGQGADPITTALLGDPVNLHAQPYGRAVDENGNADCESGQRGYPDRLAVGADPSLHIAVDARTPGNQGPTFTGLAHVPPGETFSAEPTGTAPKVAQP
jgi:virulence factor Mce-like protein